MGVLWRCGLSFAAGALLAALVPQLPPIAVIAALAAVSSLLLLVPALRVPAALLLGACWFLAHAAWQLATAWPDERAGEEVRVLARVSGLPTASGQSLRVELLTLPGQAEGLPRRIQASWFRPREYLRPGEVREFELRLTPPDGRLNPGGFDLRRHLLSQRIGAVAQIRAAGPPVRADGLPGMVDRQRQYLAERIQAQTTSLDAAALIRALGLADRTALSPELSDVLRRTGTAHLLAISGLHIGMVAALGGLLGSLLLAPISLLGQGLDRRRLAIVIGLLAALGYAFLAGLTLPTVRALTMLSVAGMALSLRRGIRPAQALVLALLAILLIDPLAPLATGFWLSFGAVAVLIWAFAWRPGAGGSGWLRGLLLAQLVIAVGMLPLNIGVFQQLIPAALLANLIAIPLVGLWILPLVLVALACLLLGWPADWALAWAAFGLDGLLGLLRWLDAQSWSYFHWAGGGLWALLAAALGAFWLLGPPGWPARWLGLALLLPLLWPQQPSPPTANALLVTVLDLGDGQAILLESAGQRLLYDAGPGDGEGRDAIGRLLYPMQARPGEWPLVGLIVSRTHRGHAGGLGSARSWASPDRIRMPPGQLEAACGQGERWQLGAYDVRFLHPSAGLPDLGDNSSCVVLIEGPGGRVLLSAGVDRLVEQRLLLDEPGLRADVLVLSRGGHRNSGSAAFLANLQPALAIASVARHDRFGRPHPELRERLERAGVPLLTTADCGALQLELRPGELPEIRSQRGAQRRFWHGAGHCP